VTTPTTPQPAGLRFVSADERLSRPPAVKMALLGPSGSGKTYLARSLDPKTTLFLDGEAGTRSLGSWGGRVLELLPTATALGLHPWELCRAVACLLSGPDTSDYERQPSGLIPGPYSPEAYATYKSRLGDPAELFGTIRTLFVDSITVVSRWSFAWADAHEASISDKGKKDTRGAYGLHGREMVRWLTRVQHAPYNVIAAGILDKQKDDLNRITWEIQIEGGKAGRELPGIFDNVVSLGRFDLADDPVTGAKTMQFNPDGGTIRGMVCTQNPWGLLAKDRSSQLDMVEPADLGKLIEKIGRVIH
jgi:hypothetical protein